MRPHSLTFLLIVFPFFLFSSLAQQPGMKILQPIGIKPHGLGKKKDVEQISRRTLVILVEDENSLDIRTLNKNLKQAVDTFWKWEVKNIEFRPGGQVQALIDNRDTLTVILRCPPRTLTITELPEENAETTLDVRMLELFMPDERRRIAVVRFPDETPRMGEMVIAVKQLQNFLSDIMDQTLEVKEDPGSDVRKTLQGKTLLLNKKDFVAFSEDQMEEIKSLYSFPIRVVSYDVIEKAILDEDPQYAFVQLVHYRRTQSLHYMLNAADGRFLGHFRSGNSLGTYLRHHPYITTKHVKRYGDKAGISYAGVYTKRFSQQYAGGMEISPRWLVFQSFYLGKSYRDKTDFAEWTDELSKVVHHYGSTTYRKTVGTAFGASFTTYLDTLLGLKTGVYFSSQGQKFYFSHFDSVQQKSRKRDIEFRMRYIKVPLLLAIHTNNAKKNVFQLFAGPQIGILQGAHEWIDGIEYQKDDEELAKSFKNKSDQVPFDASFKSVDVSFAAGGGIYRKLYGRFFLYAGLRGDISLLDADAGGIWKDASFSASRNITMGGEFGISFLF